MANVKGGKVISSGKGVHGLHTAWRSFRQLVEGVLPSFADGLRALRHK